MWSGADVRTSCKGRKMLQNADFIIMTFYLWKSASIQPRTSSPFQCLFAAKNACSQQRKIGCPIAGRPQKPGNSGERVVVAVHAAVYAARPAGGAWREPMRRRSIACRDLDRFENSQKFQTVGKIISWDMLPRFETSSKYNSMIVSECLRILLRFALTSWDTTSPN